MDTYAGVTQQQFQDFVSPHSRYGTNVAVNVPKGWRRVQASLSSNVYVNMDTNAVCLFPTETYNTRRGCWTTPQGIEVTKDDLQLLPEERNLRTAYPDSLAFKGGPIPQPTTPGVFSFRGNPDGQDTTKKAISAPAVSVAPKALAAAPTAPLAAAPAPKLAATPLLSAVAARPPVPDIAAVLPVGLLFPGQGSQYVKMLAAVQDLPAVKEMLVSAQKILGYDMLELCLQGPESKLEQTRYCQPAMYVAGLAALEKLRSEKPDHVERCKAVAGLSLGEYTALAAAGVLSFEAGLKVVKLRGEAMQEAAEASEQSMLSVAGVDQAVVEQLCREAAAEAGPGQVCQIANFLFPKGFSCAGHTAAVELLLAKVQKVDGCLQAKLLKTSGGFHTSLMASAQKRLLQALDEVKDQMRPPRCDVYMNVSGKRLPRGTSPAEIIPLLGEQLCKCVLWEPSMRAMIGDGVQEFYECGPMKQLKSMMKRIDTGAFQSMRSVDV